MIRDASAPNVYPEVVRVNDDMQLHPATPKFENPIVTWNNLHAVF